jgi:hypothetical protein
MFITFRVLLLSFYLASQVRGDLVNLCIPGDVLRVVGIVKALQVNMEGSRGTEN